MKRILNKESRATIELMIANNLITKDVAEKYFPELKESEDKKWIPKEIAKYLKEKGGFRSCWIAWLEKQGRLMKALQISNARIGELIEENYYLREQLEKQGENTYNKVLSELLHKVICTFINDPDIPYFDREKVSMEVLPYVERLEKQGEQNLIVAKSSQLGEQKPAWSEEDERVIDDAVYYLKRYNNLETTQGEFNKQYVLAVIDKLKSLRPQPQWKPSEEQLKTFEYYLDADISNKDREVLFGLYKQLKQL